MTQYLTGAGINLRLKNLIATGGQGAGIFSVHESEDMALKIFLDPETEQQRLKAMVRFDEALDWSFDKSIGIRATWPIDIITTPKGHISGYVMYYLAGHKTLYELAEPDGAIGSHQDFDWAKLLRACQRFAETTAGFHKRDVVIGDVSPHNILVHPSGNARVVDCDSFGFRDPRNGDTFDSFLFTEDFAAPERHNSARSVATIASDRFSLALVVTETLLGNVSPFRATPAQVQTGGTLIGNLVSGTADLLTSTLPRAAILRKCLPSGVLRLARMGLIDGNRNLGIRPSAAEWAETLGHAFTQVVHCTVNPWHAYCGAPGDCPWCLRAQLFGLSGMPKTD